MTETAEQLKSKLLQLPIRDRAELAHFLISSLDNGQPAEDGSPDTAKQKGQATRARARHEKRQPVKDPMGELREKHTAKLREAYAAASAHSLQIAAEWQHADEELDARLDELQGSP